jgi:hypothetical protein
MNLAESCRRRSPDLQIARLWTPYAYVVPRGSRRRAISASDTAAIAKSNHLREKF